MALLFIGSVMNVLWIALLALLVLLEKLTPFGRWIARAAGVGRAITATSISTA
jgi:predicted metal-binding membrane protein